MGFLIANCNAVDEHIIDHLEKILELFESKNKEISFLWLKLCIVTKQIMKPKNKNCLEEFLSQVGRMKFVRPLYKLLYNVDQLYARHLYEVNRNFYHSIARNEI